MAQYGNFDECNSSCNSKPVMTSSLASEESGIGMNVIMGGLLAITALFCCAYIYYKRRVYNKTAAGGKTVPGQQQQVQQQSSQQQLQYQQQQQKQGTYYGSSPGQLHTVHENGSSAGTRVSKTL